MPESLEGGIHGLSQPREEGDASQGGEKADGVGNNKDQQKPGDGYGEHCSGRYIAYPWNCHVDFCGGGSLEQNGGDQTPERNGGKS